MNPTPQQSAPCPPKVPSIYTPDQAVEALKREGLFVVPFGKALLRAVTHLDVTSKDIDKAIEAFRKIFKDEA